MLYIQDIRPGSLVLSADIAGRHVAVLDARKAGQVISVLDQACNEAAFPGFTLVHNGIESDSEFDYTCILDHERCGFSAFEARVIRHALYGACLKMCRTRT